MFLLHLCVFFNFCILFRSCINLDSGYGFMRVWNIFQSQYFAVIFSKIHASATFSTYHIREWKITHLKVFFIISNGFFMEFVFFSQFERYEEMKFFLCYIFVFILFLYFISFLHKSRFRLRLHEGLKHISVSMFCSNLQ